MSLMDVPAKPCLAKQALVAKRIFSLPLIRPSSLAFRSRFLTVPPWPVRETGELDLLRGFGGFLLACHSHFPSKPTA